ncbi:MAG: septal ring lytic transglycosylase RlpA family protein [Gammaproteobacteria bacterium]|nr:septal ring lytic transglycosylase RlpA family protein [Gammaproteobacteria bacterium]
METSSRLFGCLLLVLLTACRSGSVYVEPADGPPLHTPPDIAHLPDPIPRREPKSKRGNPPTYTVSGRTYHVLDSAVGYRATGNASWYGKKFHGRLTSSGEPFDMFKLTAAHTTLPIPTYLKVTNLDNGRSTVVRVNDRGPFHDDRIIDLSYAAAVKLDFASDGTARVRVETFARQPDFFLQAGAFRELAAADALRDDLRALTGKSVYVVRVSDDRLFRVRLGPVYGRPEAVRLQALITAADYGQPLILEQ